MEQKKPETKARRSDESARRPYEQPQLKVMDEKEVLRVFQITSAGISWWG